MAPSDAADTSDEEMRKLLKPKPTANQVVEALRKGYAQAGQEIKIIKELESYDDHNYWVEIGGTSYLVKVHNGVESKDLIDLMEKKQHEKSVIHLQNAMMDHLSKNGVSTSAPQAPKEDAVTPASIHALPVVSEAHSPCQLVVRLLRWVPGRTMASIKMLPMESLADAGKFLGRLSGTLDLLETESLTAAKRYHQWDGKNTADLRTFVQYIKDERKREMVNSVLDAFQTELIDSGVADKFPKCLIHADFNEANILVDNDLFVSGCIDFGDSIESWRVLDVTVAMAYASITSYGKKHRAISAAAALLRGYHAVHPLSSEERRHLILLVACRLACSATLGAYSYQLNPENHYLLLHSAPAWDTLDLIWGTDPVRRAETAKVINQVFDLACSDIADPNTEVMDCSDLSFPDPDLGDPLSSFRTGFSLENVEPTSKRTKSN